MQIIHNDMTAYCDVDDTLILWQPGPDQLFDDPLFIGGIPVWPHKVHIEKIKQHKVRGHFVVVWSAGGSVWAETAVKLLKLEEYVDLIICKPQWAWDDLPPEQFIRRCYIKPGEKDEPIRKA